MRTMRTFRTVKSKVESSRLELHGPMYKSAPRWACARQGRRTYSRVKYESAAPELGRPRRLGKTGVTDVQSKITPKDQQPSYPRPGCPIIPNVKVTDRLPTSYTGLLSSAGRARTPGGLNTVLESYSEQPADGRIPLHGGLPHPDAFPFAQLSVKLKSGPTLTIDAVTDAQQYATHLLGLPSLQEWTHEHVSVQHNPPGPFQVLISNGSNHAIEMVTDLLLERGDSILVESFTYFYMVDSVLPIKGYHAVPMEMDEQGICPCKLRKILQERCVTGQLPRVMYTVPCGHNPTGVVTELTRKREIYGICQQYGITIIEDDAYYYLQYPTLTGMYVRTPKALINSRGQHLPIHISASVCPCTSWRHADRLQLPISAIRPGAVPGLQQLVPTYLSIDTDSRVVRLDSWSKVLAPGLRLGWVTAHPDMVELMALALHASLNGPSGISQALMIAVTQHWGSEGFQHHCCHMQQVYQQRANVMHTAAVRELKGLAEWQRPQAGMFIWLKLLAGVHDVDDIAAELVQANVMVLPGKLAHCQGAASAYPCPHVRLSFANASEAQIREGMQRLGSVLRTYRQLTSTEPLHSGLYHSQSED